MQKSLAQVTVTEKFYAYQKKNFAAQAPPFFLP